MASAEPKASPQSTKLQPKKLKSEPKPESEPTHNPKPTFEAKDSEPDATSTDSDSSHPLNTNNPHCTIWKKIDRKQLERFYKSYAAIKLPRGRLSIPSKSPLGHISLPKEPPQIVFDLYHWFRHQQAVIYTLSEPLAMSSLFSNIPDYRRRECPQLWETIYNTWLQGPKNLHRCNKEGSFVLRRIHIGSMDRGFRGHIPSCKISLDTLVRWHRSMSRGFAFKMKDTDKINLRAGKVRKITNWSYKESFHKLFILVDHMERWEEGVLLVELLPIRDYMGYSSEMRSHDGEWIPPRVPSARIAALVGDDGIEETTELGGGPGIGTQYWKAWRIKIEKAVKVIMDLQGTADYTDATEDRDKDLIVECGFKDREINGTGIPVEHIMPSPLCYYIQKKLKKMDLYIPRR